MSFYKGKTILAPMVRVGNVGFRVFCAAQGADVVFSEEVVANKLRRCRREVIVYEDSVGPMVEFVTYEPFRNHYKRTVVFSTPGRSAANRTGEGGTPVVLQLGVSSPDVGATAALLCCKDVDGIDINMGCPKKFSVDNGMGAALMLDTTRAASILVAIDNAVNAPVHLAARGRRLPLSFKIRLLETPEATAHMLNSIMEKVGPNRIHAITLHARTVDQTSETPPHYDRAAATVNELRNRLLFRNMCFVLNGSVKSRADGAVKMKQYGFDAVMIARHAMWDMTVFSPYALPDGSCNFSGSENAETPLAATSWMDLYKDLLRSHWKYRTQFQYVKYHLTRSIPCIRVMKPLMVTVQQSANSYADIAAIYGLPVEEIESMRKTVDVETFLCIPEKSCSSHEIFSPIITSSSSSGGDGDGAKGVQGRGDENLNAPVLKKLRI